jgi:probable rRNA maturation factor
MPLRVLGTALLRPELPQRTMVVRMVAAVVREAGISAAQWDVGVRFVDERRMHALNAQYRRVDRPTDVLAFPARDTPSICAESTLPPPLADDDCDLGDVFVCVPYIRRQCSAASTPLASWLPVIVTHGVLHLLGFDHHTDAERSIVSSAHGLARVHSHAHRPRCRWLRARRACCEHSANAWRGLSIRR